MIVASWGWGLNSTWMIVKAIQGGNSPDVILSLDTGAEHDDTYCIERWYVENVWRPAGVEYVRLSPWTHPQYYDKRIEGRSLLQFCQDRSVVPLGAVRWCSAEWKGRAGDRWMEEHGVTESWLGFTAEETRRVIRRGCEMPHEAPLAVNSALPGFERPPVGEQGQAKSWRIRAPLWEDGDTRRDCALGLGQRGYPVPAKSGCGICPFNWKRLLIAARGGDPDALRWLGVVFELEELATQSAGRPVGITPDGHRLTDLWANNPMLEGFDIPVEYRPCECVV